MAKATESGPISVDQAVGILNAGKSDAAPENAEQTEPSQATEEQAAGEPEPEAVQEPEEVTPDEPLEEEPAEAIPPPASWAAKDKDLWDSVPDEVKPAILARETERDRTTQRAVQEASEARTRANDEIQSVTQIKAALDQVVPTLTRQFQGKWSNWTSQARAELARTDPGQVIALDAQFQMEQAELQRIQAVNQQTQALAFQQFVQVESQKLPQLAPDLADPKQGQARKQALATFLSENGVPADVLPTLSASTIALAYDAMRWRQAQGQIAKPKPVTPVRPAVRPSSTATTRAPQREVDAARNRLAQTGSIDDAVAYLNARG